MIFFLRNTSRDFSRLSYVLHVRLFLFPCFFDVLTPIIQLVNFFLIAELVTPF